MFLTGGAVDAVSSWFTVLAGGAMEAFVAAALPAPLSPILALPVTGAPVANISGAFKTLVAVVPRAAGMLLQNTSPLSPTDLFLDIISDAEEDANGPCRSC